VTLGQRQGSDVVIASGVAPGERVVLAGQLLVRPGSKVHVDMGDGGAGSAAGGEKEEKKAERGRS